MDAGFFPGTKPTTLKWLEAQIFCFLNNFFFVIIWNCLICTSKVFQETAYLELLFKTSPNAVFLWHSPGWFQLHLTIPSSTYWRYIHKLIFLENFWSLLMRHEDAHNQLPIPSLFYLSICCFLLIIFAIIMIDTKIHEGTKGLIKLKEVALTIKSYCNQ